jgi:aarF domain-containing kinase
MEPDAAAHGTAPAAAAAAAARPPSDTIVNSSSSSTPTGTDAAANTFTPQTAAPISRPPRSRRAIDERAQERAVPASRFGRAFQFANLGAGLAAGAVAEVGRRTFGLGSNADADAPRGSYMTPANTERLVATLCRVRGAALKLGQMVSIQDSDFLPPQLAEIFERVRESADFMPEAQLTAQLSAQLGDDWRGKFDEFDMRPFAAASIGQVHRAVLPDGVEVAVKVQYPGVADSIDSDINNLMMVLRMTGAVPKGLYIERVLDSARQELAMECDYVREAACGVRYRQLTADMQGVSCPKVYTELSGPQVLTAEMVSGVTLEHVEPMDQATRNRVAGRVLTLTLRELFEWRLMQTDPNWGNFLYDVDTDTLNLLDFGATMEYSREFIDGYIEIIHSATVIDREECLRASIALGFLSGRENSVMNDAHVSAVMALGRPFRCDGPFDFGQRDVIAEVRRLIPVMLKHREKAPPHESYSLHRKLAGAYLLCTRYKAQVDCAGAFRRLYDAYPATSSASQLPQY